MGHKRKRVGHVLCAPGHVRSPAQLQARKWLNNVGHVGHEPQGGVGSGAEISSEVRPWSVAEAARWLGKTPETIRRWARSGKLAALGKLPDGEWRFDPHEVRALLSPMRHGVQAEREEVVRARLDMTFARLEQKRRAGA